MESHQRNHEHDHSACTTETKNKTDCKDPVCGMTVEPKTARGGSSTFNHQTYYFCNPKCKLKFDLDPKKYLSPKDSKVLQSLNVEYTCPMHPEIKQMGPGSCPICGMALEPTTLTADHQDDQTEYLDTRRRFWFSVFFSIPLVMVSMGGRHFLNSHNSQMWMNYFEFALATPVVLWGGDGLFLKNFGCRLNSGN
jgi:P-type Cu+ transporter